MTVEAARRLFIEGDDRPGFEGPFTGITAQANPRSTGDASRVTVTANDLELRNGGVIDSTTFGGGDAGDVVVTAHHLLIKNDDAPKSTGISSGADFWIELFSKIVRREVATGNAGRVTVTADDLEIRDGGEISSGTFGPGEAGDVRVTAGHLFISDDGSRFATGIITNAAQPDSSGDAGQVVFTEWCCDYDAETGITLLAVPPESGGDAGRVMVTAADELTLRDGAEISSSALPGTGDAGDVQVEAGTLLVDNSSIFTLGTDAEGGRINVEGGELIHLLDAGVVSNGILPPAPA